MSLRDRAEQLIRVAGRAPSAHNSQPWQFRVGARTFDVRADRSRRLPAVDPTDRELHIACGAAAFNARLGISHLGHDTELELLPDPTDEDLLARITAGTARQLSAEHERLLAAISRRHTHRGPFAGRPPARSLLVGLQTAAAEEGAELALVERPGARRRVSDLVIAADREQRADPALRAEVERWTPDPLSDRRDGVPAVAYPSHRPDPPSAFPVRDFALGRPWGGLDPADAAGEGHAVLAVLRTDGDQPEHWLRAGLALQRVLLTAAVEWAFASFLPQPVELDHVRWQLADETGGGFPQMLMLLGHAGAAPLTPRRPADELHIE